MENRPKLLLMGLRRYVELSFQRLTNDLTYLSATPTTPTIARLLSPPVWLTGE